MAHTWDLEDLIDPQLFVPLVLFDPGDLESDNG